MFALAVLIAAAIAAAVALWLAARNRAWLARQPPSPARHRADQRTLGLAARLLGLSALAALGAGGGAGIMVADLGAAVAVAAAALARPAVDLALTAWDLRRTRRNADIPDRLRASARGFALLAPFAMMVGWAAEAAADLWWLPAGMGWLAVVAWNEVRPRSAAVPADCASPRLTAIAAAAGLPHIPILASASRAPQANARADGILAWRRVVLDRSLVERLSAAEVDAVCAHEFGHLKGRHREFFTLWRLCSGLGLLSAGHVLGGGGPASLCLAILAAPVIRFLVAPAENAVIGRLEFAADATAATLAGPSAMGAALQRLAEVNHTLPAQDGLHDAFHSPHPSLAARLARLAAI